MNTDNYSSSNSKRNISFLQWLLQKDNQFYNRLLSILGVLGTIGVLIWNKLPNQVFADINETYTSQLLMLLNFIILFIALVTKVEFLEKNSIGKKGHKNNLALQKQFNRAVKGFWMMTLLLYATLFIKSKYNDSFSGRVKDELEKINQEALQVDQSARKLDELALLNLNDSTTMSIRNLCVKIETSALNLRDSLSYFIREPMLSHDVITQLSVNSEAFLEILRTSFSVDTSSYLKDSTLNNVYTHSNIMKADLLVQILQLSNQCKAVKEQYNQTKIKLYQIIEILISDLGSIFLFIAFLVLYPETNKQKPGHYNTVDHSGKSYLVVNNFSLRYYKNKEGYGAVLALRNWVRIIISVTIIHILLVCTLSAQGSDVAYDFIKLISGLFNALALCLLIARFESSHMASPLFLLVTLFLYANIQTMFGLFGVTIAAYHAIFDNIAYVIAAFGKTMLFLYILWIFSTGRLYDYLQSKLEPENISGPEKD